jgi:DNA primase
MIPQSFIQDLLARVDIVDVIDRHVKLRRAGADYSACCPFHNEKTPSFTVSQTKQFYHCFGCGAHGSAIGFLMEYSGLGFVEAVKELAQSVGMQVPDARPEPALRRAEAGDDLHSVLLKAAHYYRAQLKSAPQAIEYLKGRGLSGEIAKQFGIGYAPDGWQNLAAVFPDYGARALAAAGLVKQSEEGRRYDVFRNRIMFPIVDVRGNVIGFGGRVLGEGEPKYLNSPETAVFEKGRELYGLYQARRAIRDAGRVVVVEGYMDVVALAQHGIAYAVATLGTATTPLHVQKLLRQTEEVVFCFDGDEAGRRAAWRALENALGQLADGKQVRFLFLPQGEDPDSYVRSCGAAAFEALVDGAVPLSQFLIDGLLARVDAGTSEGRARLLQEARPLVAQVSAPLLSLMLRKRLAEVAGVTREELDAQYQIKSRPAPAPVRRPPPAQGSLVRTLIELLLLDPRAARGAARGELAGAAGVGGIDQDELAFLDLLLEICADNPDLNLTEHFRGTEHEAKVARLQAGLLTRPESAFSPEELQRQFDGAWDSLCRRIRKAKFDALNEKSKKQELTVEEKALYRALLQAAKGAPRNESTANLR